MQACERRESPTPASSSQQEATFQEKAELLRGAPEEPVNPEPRSTPTQQRKGGIISSDEASPSLPALAAEYFGLEPAYGDRSKTPTSLSPTLLLWPQGEKENPFAGK